MLLTLAAVLAAAPVTVPAGEAPPYLRLSMNSASYIKGAARRAAPAGDSFGWLTPDGATLQAMTTLKGATWTSGTVTIDASGAVTGCVPGSTGSSGMVVLAEAICADIMTNGRFVPALDAAGQRTGGQLRFGGMATTKRGLWGEGGDNPPLVAASPAPPAPPAPLNYWRTSWHTDQYAVRGQRPFLGDRRALAEGRIKWVGVALSLNPQGKTACAVAKSSNDPGLDAKACKAAAKFDLAPKGPISRVATQQIMMIYEVNKPTALLPTQEFQPAQLTDDGARALAAILGKPVDRKALAERVDARVDRDGRALDCIVTKSEGNDAQDLALCRALTAGTLLTPAQDIYGLTTTSWL